MPEKDTLDMIPFPVLALSSFIKGLLISLKLELPAYDKKCRMLLVLEFSSMDLFLEKAATVQLLHGPLQTLAASCYPLLTDPMPAKPRTS